MNDIIRNCTGIISKLRKKIKIYSNKEKIMGKQASVFRKKLLMVS